MTPTTQLATLHALNVSDGSLLIVHPNGSFTEIRAWKDLPAKCGTDERPNGMSQVGRCPLLTEELCTSRLQK